MKKFLAFAVLLSCFGVLSLGCEKKKEAPKTDTTTPDTTTPDTTTPEGG